MILAGTNDIAGNAGPVSLESVEQNLTRWRSWRSSMASGWCWRPCCPSPMTSATARGGRSCAPRAVPLPSCGASMIGWPPTRAQNGHVYLDYFTAVADANGVLRPDLNDDGLHPNAAGYALMAPRAERAITEALH